MKTHITPFKLAVMAVLSLAAFGAAAFGHVEALFIAPAAAADWDALNKLLDGIENRLKTMSDKAEGEFKTLGQVSTDNDHPRLAQQAGRMVAVWRHAKGVQVHDIRF